MIRHGKTNHTADFPAFTRHRNRLPRNPAGKVTHLRSNVAILLLVRPVLRVRTVWVVSWKFRTAERGVLKGMLCCKDRVLLEPPHGQPNVTPYRPAHRCPRSWPQARAGRCLPRLSIG